MTVTYTPANAAPNNDDYISAVRFIIQDTDVATAEILDEEVTAIYDATSEDDDQQVRNYTVAVSLGLALHRRYAKQASFTSGKTSVSHTERAKYWSKAVDELRGELQAAQMAAGMTDKGGIIYAGRSSNFLDQTGINESFGGFIR